MAGYEVVPEALRRNANVLADMADTWAEVERMLAGACMDSNDLGLLATPPFSTESAPEKHNEAVTAVADKVAEGREALEKAKYDLKQVTEEYESREAEYYREFGYTAETLNLSDLWDT